MPTAQVIEARPADTSDCMVGDAYMAPSELIQRGRAIDYWHDNQTPGIAWLHRLRSKFTHAVWLNPIPEAHWRSGWTIRAIAEMFAMFPLSIKGLDAAVDELVREARHGRCRRWTRAGAGSALT